MLLSGKSGIDLPPLTYDQEETPARRLTHKEELMESWWYQWSVQCFDSLVPTQRWTQEQRGVKVGDLVLILYPCKSKLGTWRVGIVEKVEVDQDGLTRTCVVSYRLLRRDLPEKELRVYDSTKGSPTRRSVYLYRD